MHKSLKYWKLLLFLVVGGFVVGGLVVNAADWYAMDQITPDYEYISNTSNDDRHVIMRLHNDKPRVIFGSGASSFSTNLYYTQWDNTDERWETAGGSAGTEIIGFSNSESGGPDYIDAPEMELDSNGYPLIAVLNLTPSPGKVMFTKWNGSAWTDAAGTGSYDILGDANTVLDMTLDSNDYPHIVWREDVSGNWEVFYIKWNGSDWTHADGSTAGKEQVGTFGSGSEAPLPNIMIWNDNPIIVTNEAESGADEIYYTEWNGTNWVYGSDGAAVGWEKITNTGSALSNHNVLAAIDPGGDVKIVWNQDPGTGASEIMYVQLNRSSRTWTFADGTTLAGPDNSYINQNLSNNSGISVISLRQAKPFALDSFGNPGVLWLDNTSGDQDIYYSKWDGSSWAKGDGTAGYDNLSDTVISGTSSGTAACAGLQFNSVGEPYVEFCDNSGGYNESFFTQYTPGTGWTQADQTTLGADKLISDATAQNSNLFLQIDSVNEPFIVGLDDSSGNLEVYFTRWAKTDHDVIEINAPIDPVLTLELSSNICNLGTFSTSNIVTCSYNALISTNAPSGYIAYIRESEDLNDNNGNFISDVTGGTIDFSSGEEYGVGTNDTETTLDIENYTGNCSDYNLQSTTPFPAAAITDYDQSFAVNTGPGDDTATLCHGAIIAGDTEAGIYSHVVTITVVGSF